MKTYEITAFDKSTGRRLINRYDSFKNLTHAIQSVTPTSYTYSECEYKVINCSNFKGVNYYRCSDSLNIRKVW